MGASTACIIHGAGLLGEEGGEGGEEAGGRGGEEVGRGIGEGSSEGKRRGAKGRAWDPLAGAGGQSQQPPYRERVGYPWAGVPQNWGQLAPPSLSVVLGQVSLMLDPWDGGGGSNKALPRPLRPFTHGGQGEGGWVPVPSPTGHLGSGLRLFSC